jgi:parallel beta-helix repeat protein
LINKKNKNIYKKVSLLTTLIIIFILPISAAQINIYNKNHLNNDFNTYLRTIIVPDDFNTINEAIQHSINGDIIYVREGLYKENININKMIILEGESMDVVTIDGNGNDNTIIITSDGVTVKGFNIINSGSLSSGIKIEDNHYNIIKMNIISSNGYGIKLYNSNGNTIVDNYISNNRLYGLKIEASHMNNITRNNIENNQINGVFLNNTSTFNNLKSNQILKNGLTTNTLTNFASNSGGIVLDSAVRSNSIAANNISTNNIGVNSKGSSENNQFYINTLIENQEDNAFDSASNIWNTENIGNYWDDYSGIDENNDGIGDTPYYIPGGNNSDVRPLVEPTIPKTPIIEGPDEIKIGREGSWHVFTLNPINEGVIYRINWGDGSDWEYSTNVNPDIGHTFTNTYQNQKTYKLTAQAIVRFSGETLSSQKTNKFRVIASKEKTQILTQLPLRLYNQDNKLINEDLYNYIFYHFVKFREVDNY